jgi:hypothetical protein
MPGRRLTAKERAIRDRNRANAQKSTGPRTAAGKRRAALNGLRHGLWAAGADPADEGEVAARVTALRACVATDDPAAAAAVERFARAWHRLDLADRMEARLLDALTEAGEAPGAALMSEPRALGEFGAIDRFRGRARAELARAAQALQAHRREAPNAVGGANPQPAFFSLAQRVVGDLDGPVGGAVRRASQTVWKSQVGSFSTCAVTSKPWRASRER